MPNLLHNLLPAYNWLKALDPSLPRALFVALVFVTVMAWRKLSPTTWIKFSSLVPVSDADVSWFKATLRKAWQALPSAALGALYGALGTGGALWPTLKLALLGLLAPVIHDVAQKYQGRLGTKKDPPPSDPDNTVRIVPPAALSTPPDRSRLHNDLPDEPAEFRRYVNPAWRLLPVLGILMVCLLSCASLSSVKPPCDDAKLRAIDANYAAAVVAVCLPAYDSKEACPAWPVLEAKHRADLRKACPQ